MPNVTRGATPNVMPNVMPNVVPRVARRPAPNARRALRLGAALLLAAPARAQSPAARPAVAQTASTGPLALPFGLVSGEYERAVGRRGFALGVGGLASVTREPFLANDGGSAAFRSLQLKLKYYPREDGLRGFAVGLTAGVAHERELWYRSSMIDASGRETILDEAYRARTAPTLGATLDYNFLLGRERRFLLGAGVGTRRALGVRAHTGPLGGPLFDPRLQVGFGF